MLNTNTTTTLPTTTTLLHLCRQFRLLLQRSWRQISRDKAAAMARLMSNLSSAVIFGAIFFRMQVWLGQGTDSSNLGSVVLCKHLFPQAMCRRRRYTG